MFEVHIGKEMSAGLTRADFQEMASLTEGYRYLSVAALFA